METFITVAHVSIGCLLAIGILLQHRVSGLSATFGGSGAVVVQRRGAEKVIYHFSIWLAVLFFALSIVRWYL
jgi:protein translocase SecG subunit